jgi:hypothetical protein
MSCVIDLFDRIDLFSRQILEWTQSPEAIINLKRAITLNPNAWLIHNRNLPFNEVCLWINLCGRLLFHLPDDRKQAFLQMHAQGMTAHLFCHGILQFHIEQVVLHELMFGLSPYVHELLEQLMNRIEVSRVFKHKLESC